MQTNFCRFAVTVNGFPTEPPHGERMLAIQGGLRLTFTLRTAALQLIG